MSESTTQVNGDAGQTLAPVSLLDSKPTDPIKLLEELGAYLSFRLCCDAPSIPHDEILAIKKSIRAALASNTRTHYATRNHTLRTIKLHLRCCV